jgi:hypothetical protein
VGASRCVANFTQGLTFGVLLLVLVLPPPHTT